MSLIQEALRRRDEEKGRPPAGRGGSGMPPRVELPRRDKPSRGWLAVMSLLLVILVVLAAGVGLLFFVFRSMPGLGSVWQTEVPVPPVEARSRGLEPQPHKEPPATPQPPAPAPVAGPVPDKRPAPPEPAGMPYGVLPAASLEERPVKAAASATAEAPRPSPPPSPAPAARRAISLPDLGRSRQAAALRAGEWPLLKVTGVLTKGPAGEGSAIINNEIIGVDEDIEGVTVREVSSGGVWLEYGGKRRYVKVGRSTQP